MTEEREQLKKDLETQTRLAEDRLNRLKYLKTDFENYRKREGEERARLAIIEEYSEDAILGQTLDGIITSWNTGAERIYGYSDSGYDREEYLAAGAAGSQGRHPINS